MTYSLLSAQKALDGEVSLSRIWERFERVPQQLDETMSYTREGSEISQWTISREKAANLITKPLERELYKLADLACETPARNKTEVAYKARILEEYLEEKSSDISDALAHSLVEDCIRQDGGSVTSAGNSGLDLDRRTSRFLSPAVSTFKRLHSIFSHSGDLLRSIRKR